MLALYSPSYVLARSSGRSTRRARSGTSRRCRTRKGRLSSRMPSPISCSYSRRDRPKRRRTPPPRSRSLLSVRSRSVRRRRRRPRIRQRRRRKRARRRRRSSRSIKLEPSLDPLVCRRRSATRPPTVQQASPSATRAPTARLLRAPTAPRALNARIRSPRASSRKSRHQSLKRRTTSTARTGSWRSPTRAASIRSCHC